MPTFLRPARVDVIEGGSGLAGAAMFALVVLAVAVPAAVSVLLWLAVHALLIIAAGLAVAVADGAVVLFLLRTRTVLAWNAGEVRRMSAWIDGASSRPDPAASLRMRTDQGLPLVTGRIIPPERARELPAARPASARPWASGGLRDVAGQPGRGNDGAGR